jgi:hypothetical protein
MSYWTDRQRIEELYPDNQRFKTADRMLFFGKLEELLHKLKVKVKCLEYFDLSSDLANVFEISGLKNWRPRLTNKSSSKVTEIETFLEDALSCYFISHYIEDNQLSLVRWEIDIQDKQLYFERCLFKHQEISRACAMKCTFTIEQTLQPAQLNTSCKIDLFKYKDPVEAFTLIRAEILANYPNAILSLIDFDLLHYYEELPSWNYDLSIPKQTTGDWLNLIWKELLQREGADLSSDKVISIFNQ